MYERFFQLQEETLKILANQKRLEILQLLKQQELTVSKMVDMIGLPQANLSQHLSILRKMRLVSTRKEGLHVYYRLTDQRIALVIKELRQFLRAQYAHEPEIAQIGVLDSKNIYPIVRDPVCGMRVSIHEAGESVDMKGEIYYFCAAGCKKNFMKSPKHYSNTNKVKS